MNDKGVRTQWKGKKRLCTSAVSAFWIGLVIMLLEQGGVAGASTQAMNYTWKMDVPHQMVEMEKSMMTTSYEYHDWMTMVEKSTPTCTRPLQTLELFPITTTSLKEECTTSKQLSAWLSLSLSLSLSLILLLVLNISVAFYLMCWFLLCF